MVDAVSDKRPRFELRRFLETHPLASLGSLIVSVATLVGVPINYLSEQRVASLTDKHTAEISNLNAKHGAEVSGLASTIEELSSRMSSIERRVPGSGPVYFDVSTVTIPEEKVLRLPSTYTQYDGGGFYVALPRSGGWSYDYATEYDFSSQTYPTLISLLELGSPELARHLKASPIHLWRADRQVTFSVPPQGFPDERAEFSFRPLLYVQHLDADFFEARTSSILTSMIGPAGTGGSAVPPVTESDLPLPAGPDMSAAAAAAAEQVSQTQETVEALSRLYSSDLASFTFFDFAGSAIQRQLLFPIKMRVISAEKRANVFYIQAHWEILKGEVSGDGIEGSVEVSELQRKLVIAEELFFFGRGADGYLVHVFVPLDGQQDSAYGWITAWLSGLQIPARL